MKDRDGEKFEIVKIAAQANRCRKFLESKLGKGFDRRDGRRTVELVEMDARW